MKIIFHDKKSNFREMFDNETGLYIRTGILNENGKDTGVDPFMRCFPELLDIGIMGSCIHGESGLCIKSNVQCYQNGFGVKKPNMTIEQFESIAKQCKNKTFQFALGGRGDVNKHENFKEILYICKKYNIVPNYTTSGLNLTNDEVEITKSHCGAVAVSAYDMSENGYTTTAINKFIKAGIKTNIHYVLGNNSIDMAIDYLKNNKFSHDINAIIFLLHKPVGLGQENNVLLVTDPKVKEFYELVNENKYNYKIGFDSCSVPGLLTYASNVNKMSIEGCEGALFSAYIDSEMNMMCCSFDNQFKKWSLSLNDYTIQEVWDSNIFEQFRNIHKTGCKESCKNCKDLTTICRPCPIVPQIAICNK